MPQTREQYNEYMRLYMKRRFDERKALALRLLGRKCVRCGSTEKLQFDHIDRSKKFHGLTEMYGHSESRFMEELRKCQLLCAGCHYEKTLEDLGGSSAFRTHGTLSSYRVCRCDLCKKAKSDWTRDYFKTHVRKRNREKL